MGFSLVSSDNVVTFLGEDGIDDNRRAVITNSSSTLLEISVPSRAASGPIEVSVGEDKVETDVFEVLPTITEL